MKKTLTAIALFTAFAAVTADANANYRGARSGAGVYETSPMHIGRSEGLQNYYYYFGSNCCGSTVAGRGGRPCGISRPAAPVASGCDTCPPINIVVPMEERCAPCPQPCDPCGGGMSGMLPWNW